MEVEMRRVGIARIAEQPEHRACCDLVARLDAQAALLHVRIEGEASFSDIDDDIIAQRHLKRDAFRTSNTSRTSTTPQLSTTPRTSTTPRLRVPLEREDNALKREIKLLRRELTMLREEVRVARGLQGLREEVAEARQEVPKMRALEQRVRAEASLVRADVTTKQAEMRQELAAHKRTLGVLQARHSNTDFNLARFMKSMANVQTSEFAYESANERMIVRQTVHPDAAKALREFAATVLDNDDAVH